MYLFDSATANGRGVRGSAFATLRTGGRGDEASSLGWFGDNPPHALRPEDIAVEMINQRFLLKADVASPQGGVLSAGAVVTSFGWSNDSDLVPVQVGGHLASAPKTLLRPVPPGTAGIAPYSVGVSWQAPAVQKREQAVNDWINRGRRAATTKEPIYKAELKRLQDLLATSRRVLNRFLIQETMYNRFDPLIAQWVDFYNRQFKFSGANALDPNVVKSMIFRESHMGTSGLHMQIPPETTVKTRFNLMQVIDSSAAALLIMLQEIAPGIVAARKLTNLEADLAAAKKDLKRLNAMANRNAAQDAQRTKLLDLARRNWEIFIWTYRAPGATSGFFEAVADLFASPAAPRPPLNEDYSFWIRAGVRWLFEKRRAVKSWDEAVKAYNGSGTDADAYQKAVLDRVDEAKKAFAAGKPFTATG